MKKVQKEKEDKDCWFCYNNPRIDKSLIINSKWKYFYLALAKGPVCDEHFLILPKDHIAHSLELNKEQEEELAEIKRRLLDQYLVEDRKMDYILFERNMPFKF